MCAIFWVLGPRGRTGGVSHQAASRASTGFGHCPTGEYFVLSVIDGLPMWVRSGPFLSFIPLPLSHCVRIAPHYTPLRPPSLVTSRDPVARGEG